ncbi:ATP-binding protein [Nocardia fluminea]|uniref:AAA family ATPase n=1 Tax=Nocardia fluminea TaxID=134984 RepID=UPI00366DA001
MSKPAHLFDRDIEWNALIAFASRTTHSATLGIVSGRRRMGKTYLLRALAEQRCGFYFGATTATSAESLRQLGAALGEFSGAGAPIAFDNWDHAISYLFALGAREKAGASLLIVLDEFPYLVKSVPELPSLVQREIDRYQTESSGVRLLLCGSAMSVMGGLLAANAPLRGRAQLELLVQPFGYRAAAQFWDATHDPALAVRLHAIVGGTPAYRRQFLADDVPTSAADLDDWLCRTVLSPLSPLFREARYLLAEEAEIRDTALYHSVLAAVAQGHNTRGGIAGYIGRKSVDISHPLTVLEDCHLISRELDVFRSGRSIYRITEPLISFYEAVMRPAWARLETGQAQQVWRRSTERFNAQVAGRHFEQMCRTFLLTGGVDRLELTTDFGTVGCGVVSDQHQRTQIQIDTAVTDPGDGGTPASVSLLGEAKWGTTVGKNHLERLLRARTLLTERGWDTSNCKLALFSGAGFSDALRREIDGNPEVILIGSSELYAPLD